MITYITEMSERKFLDHRRYIKEWRGCKGDQIPEGASVSRNWTSPGGGVVPGVAL